MAALAANCLCAQDVERVIDDTKKSLQDPVTVTGSIGASSVFYRAFGIQARRDPFYWVLNANLTLTLFNKISVPFSAVYTQQDKNFSNGLDKFSQPFNQFGISPRYRWLTVHAGYRSLEFSEYSLSGTIWLGGGVEIKPERSPWSASGFYGRFLKAVPKGGVEGIVVSLPSFARFGGGAKITMSLPKTTGEISFLRIKDDPYSIPFDTILPSTPQENELLTLSGKQQLTNWVSASTEFGLSIFTKNLYEEKISLQKNRFLSTYFDVRPSTQVNKVINSSLDFSPGKIHLALRYKRVDPDYRSLGAIFLTSDVEEISGNTDFVFLRGKVSSSAGLGLQRNNLDQKQALTSRRVVGSTALSVNFSEQLNLSLNYSSFSSNTQAQRDAFSDSIRFVQVSQNLTMSNSFAFGKNVKQQFFTSGTFQETTGTGQLPGKVWSGNVSYMVILGESGWSVNAAGLYNQMGNELIGTVIGYGPQLSLQKTMFRSRLRVGLNGGFQDNFTSGFFLSKNITGSGSISFALAQGHNLKCDYSFLERISEQAIVKSFSEMRLNVGYTCAFKASKKDLAKK